MNGRTVVGGVAAVMLLVACGAQDTPAPRAEAPPPPTAAAAAPTVALTGDTIVVEMITDADGSYFKPANFVAKRGDVVRFVLTMGVHNVSFPADSNAGITGLPPTSDMLQLPGQQFDAVIAMPAGGSYFYQCDPHALLGMVGRITVE